MTRISSSRSRSLSRKRGRKGAIEEEEVDENEKKVVALAKFVVSWGFWEQLGERRSNGGTCANVKSFDTLDTC